MDLQDKIIQPRGHVNIKLIKDNKIINEFEDHNVIVNMASILMAARMAPDYNVSKNSGQRVISATPDPNDNIEETRVKNIDTSGTYPYKYGFQYLAIGDGNVNNYNTPAEKALYIMNASTDPAHTLDKLLERTQLFHETYRQLIDQWYFVGEDDNPSENPTGKIRLSTLITINANASLANTYICELGLFGGNTSLTASANDGTLFNIRVIDGWKLIPDSKLLVNWTITF